MIRFSQPLALLLLLLLPLIASTGWPARGYNRRRELASLALRLVISLCLILGLAGLEINLGGSSYSLAVVFAVDVSDSMPDTAIQAARNYIQEALLEAGPNDQAAVILFGRDALVERRMSADPTLAPFTSRNVTNQTDLAEAIYLGLAVFPPDAARRMVILSDGVQTSGNAEEAARTAAASGVEILAAPLTVELQNEVLVTSVEAPSNLRQGDQFDLAITLEATQPGPVRIRVLASGAPVYEGERNLERGVQTFSLPIRADTPGFLDYQVQVIPVEDQYYQNNSLSTFTQISGPPQVLLVAPPPGEAQGFNSSLRPDEYSALRAVLESSGFVVDLVQPVFMPSELPALAPYAAVVMVDVPARQLTQRQMSSLQAYVRDLGGGLVVVGGPTSYGVGGYFRTPLEETLPVDMQIKDEQRRPTLAMVFIIDHSGSMSDTSGGASKLDLAKEAVIRSVELLNPMDQVGVVIFDDAASWVVPMQELDDAAAVQSKVAQIGVGGGTDILAGVQAMAEVLPNVQAGARHVILLTDGGADPTGIPELVQQLNQENGITLSAIGVGQDAAPFLPRLAELGGGRYHFAADPGSIPSIYTEETSLATRAYIVEEPFTPSLVSNSPILEGITALPGLYGYVGVSAKQTAQTILVSHKDDPILASWRYGLGKAVAFTSDATGRWAVDWLGWEGFATFWAQAVRYTISENLPSNLNMQINLQGEQAHLVVDASTAPGGNTGAGLYLNNYQLEANIVAPDGITQTVRLLQTAPGLYAADFTPGEEGVYLLRINGQAPQAGGLALGETAGWSLAYSPEYRQTQADPDALARLAAAAGGSLAPQDPGRVFAHTLPYPGSYQPAWPWLFGLAAILLPVDIALRRLVISMAELHRMIQRITAWTAWKKPAAETLAAPRTSTLDGLMKVKESASQRFQADRPARTAVERESKSGRLAGQATPGEKPSPQQKPEVPSPSLEKPATRPLEERPASAPAEKTEASSVSALLASKRARRKDD